MSLEVSWYLDAALDTLTLFDLHGRRSAFTLPRFIDSAEGTPFTLRLPPPVSRTELEQLLRALRPTSESSEGSPTREERARARGYFRPPFRHPPWLPQFRPAQAYTREVTQAFEGYTAGYGGASEAEKKHFRRALREYMAAARQEARQAGWEPSPHMRADSAEKAEDDEALRAFRRLALYFAGNHPTEIATAEDVDESTVRKSNAATAQLLGLVP